MGQALYRKYRSKKLSEVIGQEHVTQTLDRAIKSGRISHAYLFTGPRGVGKTTVARILAHEVNELPYDSDDIHLDIIEIDAASNRRIDEVRDLREKVHISPTSAKYKVYIIDEVHMLTREAFNALLKTLEEPPAHCIFILATTEAHKLPETIVSRTQRFSFKPIDPDDAQKHLGTIAKTEKIDIEPEALSLLAEYGQGSFRDSISLLDQLSSNKEKITVAQVKEFLGLPPAALISDLIAAVKATDTKKILELISDLKEQGINPALAAKALAAEIRSSIIDGTSAGDWTSLLKSLLDVPASDSPYETLEISLLEASASKTSLPKGNDSKPFQDIPTERIDKVIEKVQDKPEIKSPKQINGKSFSLDQWDELLFVVKSQAASLYTALRLANPTLEDNTLTLSFKFPLHQKKVARAENLQIIESAIRSISDGGIKIECTTGPLTNDLSANDKVDEPYATSAEMNTISNIFGSAEVLES